MNCCFFIPIKTGVYLITILGLLNRLSGFYGLIVLDYSDPVVFCIHLYSLLSLGGFAMGLFGIHNDEHKLIRRFVIVYWFDFVITTMTTIYLAIQWFIFTDHSTPEKNNFEFESILSIVILTLFRLFHIYSAYILTCYSTSFKQYSKLPTDEEKQSIQL